MLCAVPALRALRARLPAAEITVVGLPVAHLLRARFPRYVDAVLESPGFPGLEEHPGMIARLPAFLTAAQARHFDLAIQMHGSGRTSNLFALLLGARATAGCFVPGDYCPDPDRFVPYPGHLPEVERLLHLLAALGVPPQGNALEFPLTAADRATLAAGPARGLAPRSYVCLHPGAADPARRWAPGEFAALGDALAARGFTVVLTGAAAEAGLTRAVAAKMGARAIDLAGRTDLGALAALLADARLLICNNTGVSHLAAALATPSVVIFTTAEVARWAPLNRRRHRPVEPSSAGAVVAEVDALLAGEAAYAA